MGNKAGGRDVCALPVPKWRLQWLRNSGFSELPVRQSSWAGPRLGSWVLLSWVPQPSPLQVGRKEPAVSLAPLLYQ